MIFIPNFRRAKEIYYQNMAYQSIICKRMADIAGINKVFIDPYTKAEILSSTDDKGNKFCYCAGPNGVDNKGTDDDVILENLFNKKK